MNIFNQATTPKGQPVLPFKGSNPREVAAQNVPMTLPLHGTHPLKPFQLGSSKGNLSAIATEETSQRGSSFVPVDGFKSQTQASMLQGSINSIRNLSEYDPWALNFSSSLMEDEKLNLFDDSMEQLDCGTSKLNDVLVVAVSSAMKLDSKQIELISRKMQRLTGFRKLRLENVIDPSLIAGFIISYDTNGSQAIDLSVKGQLAALAARVESSDRRITGQGQC